MARPPGLLDVFAVREFRALWAADAVSLLGDQLARVALAVLVYQRTSSAALTALVYGLTMVPTFLGGVLLSGLADRRPRRELMVAVDLGRVAVAGLLAVPGTPLWALCVLVFVLTLVGPAHRAAAMALMPTVLGPQRYPNGLAVRTATHQIGQVAGFAGGGLLIAWTSPAAALAANAVTFGVSALVLWFGLTRRGTPDAERRTTWLDGVRGGAALVWRDRRLRWLTALTWLVGVYTVPEALAAPYADEVALGVAAVGLLMAADPIGSAIGVLVFTRWVPEHLRERAIGLLAFLAGVPLLLTLTKPGLIATVVLWGVSGAFSTACITQTQASFVPLVPDARRGQAVGMVGAGLLASQGLVIVVAGVVADVVGPAAAITVSAAVATALAVPAGLAWRRARSRRPVVEAAGTGHDLVGVKSHRVTTHERGSSSPPPPVAGVVNPDPRG